MSTSGNPIKTYGTKKSLWDDGNVLTEQVCGHVYRSGKGNLHKINEKRIISFLN